MPYDYSKLRGRIVEKVGTQTRFAEEMGFSERTCSLKINGKVPFTQPEIIKACRILDIAEGDIGAYFFKLKVQLD